MLVRNTIIRFGMQDPIEQEYDKRVARMLSIDDLSGLLVRRKFDANLEAALAAAHAAGSPLGFLMMDMDGIKSINDTHGHFFGAFVIGEAGHIIGRLIEGRGFASRFGGDEFVAALPDADIAKANTFARQVLRAVRNHHFRCDSRRRHKA